MRLKAIAAAGVAALAFLSGPTPAQSFQLIYGADGTNVIGIDGLEVEGITYDVTFERDSACLLYTSPSPRDA